LTNFSNLVLLRLEIHRHDAAVSSVYLRYLRALLGVSGEHIT